MVWQNQIVPSSFEIYFEFLYLISKFQTTYLKNSKTFRMICSQNEWHVELFQPDTHKTLEVFQ